MHRSSLDASRTARAGLEPLTARRPASIGRVATTDARTAARFASAGLLAALCVVPRPAGADTSCPPAAEVTGDPDVVASVAAHLRVMGVASAASAPPSCKPVTARVARDGDRLRVLVDDSGGSQVRQVGDARIAATWILSFARVDIGAPLLTPPSPAATPGVSPPGAAPGISGDPEPPGPGSTTARRPAPRAAATVRLERMSNDGADSLDGVSAGACLRAGWVCLGVRGRWARVTGIPSTPDLLSLARRSNTELLATVEVPLRISMATVRPSVGIGVGRMVTEREPPSSDPMAPGAPPCPLPDGSPCDEPPFSFDDRFGATHYDARIEAELAASLPITPSIGLDVAGGATLLPSAHREPFRPRMSGNPERDALVDSGYYDLPGEPMHVWRVSVGLRVSVP